LREVAVPSFDSIAVLGAGAWGTALANVAARARHDVALWARDPDHVAEMAATRESRRLPGVRLEPGVRPEASLAAAAAADLVLCAAPAQATRALALSLAPLLRPATPVVLCSKGIERTTSKFMSDVIAECLPRNPPAALSGPSFAADVSRGLPTAVTLAAEDPASARAIAATLAGPGFRLYHSTDLRGVEIGGAAKNVLAIACGVAAGRGLGASAGAALVARGFAELSRFGRVFGARAETLMGLSGLGDLVLTCSSTQSRNFSYGMALGRGEGPQAAAHGSLAEGAHTASVLVEMARARGVDMPICEAVEAIIAGRIGVDGAVEALLARPSKSEI
jgi:glycerol-3-phosphate dehydrogenase (NAD(P)+)